jgi:hypothetical protein
METMMKITWHPRANNFWMAKLEEPAKILLKSFNGSYHDSNLEDIGYVCRVSDKFVVRFYGSVYSGSHPVERCRFNTKEEAMECAESFAIAALIAKILSH